LEVAGLISPQLLDQIRNASDIVDVIGSYIPLKRAGANFVALCPFHREKTPSFNVNPHRQIFHCFGCHKGGDVISFVRDYESLSFVEAVKRLAEKANIPLEFENDPNYRQTRELKELLLEIHEKITQTWHQLLLEDRNAEAARAYLRSRAVDEEAVKLFRLGYAPDAWDHTVNWALSKQYELSNVERGGLILKRERGEGYYDRFRGRLIFPICDDQGRVIGFSGRVLDAEAKTAKYVNSPETPLFTKGRVFFGLDKSKRAILDAQTAIVCEGQLDLIRCMVNGVQNVVAPQGTALTGDQARVLKRYCEEVVLCFDADAAGLNAAERSFESLAGIGLTVRVASVPQPHDPDSFIRERGADAFRSLVDDAPGYFDFLLERLRKDNDVSTDRGRLAVVQAMGTALDKGRSPILTDTYTRKIAMLLGLSVEAVREGLRRATRGRRTMENEEMGGLSGELESAPKPNAHEMWLLHLLLKEDDLLEWFGHHLNPEWISHPGVKELFCSRLSDHDCSLASFVSGTTSDGLRAMASEVLADEREIHEPERQAEDLVLKLRNRHFDSELGRLRALSASGELDDEQQLDLLRQMEGCRQAKRAPLERLPEF
jgi:DNA primase